MAPVVNSVKSEADSATHDEVDRDLVEGLSSTRVSAIKDETRSSKSSSPTPTSGSGKTSYSSSTLASHPANSSKSVEITGEVEDRHDFPAPIKEPPKSAKSGRSAAPKNSPRNAPLFDDLPDATVEANSSYTVIHGCTYQNKFLGYTEHAMECDCNEEWDSVSKTNEACGEDSDCINRATKMECVGDCACGAACQNQRFGRQLYADVSVIKTDKKGYGLRTNVDLKNGDFIFEYIGEVIAEAAFRRRMVQYDEEGVKHFYFMSLSKGEFVDATKKGNLGRFCNHSCNPNCYVDKWVVGDKLRMGIFAERKIKAGEELVFNYNVDRYGANPQPCYCGESNCTGFIGGKTQTERATKLSAATIEALGIEDDLDDWDTVVAKKPKKKKTDEEDEDYVESVEAKRLEADGVTKVMAALMQCKEKWIAVKLLQRIQRATDEDVRHRIVKLHGYQIMNSQLSAWRDDENVMLQILDILDTFPRLTRNKIVDAKIDKTLEPLAQHADERVSTKARSLLESWSKLELAYRIPRKIRDTTGTAPRAEGIKFERRESAQQRKRSRSRSRSRSKSPPKGPGTSLPSGPKNAHWAAPPPFRRGPPPLPRGWSQAVDEKSGRTYFYTSKGTTQWVRPTQPADPPPPPPAVPKGPSEQDVLKSIIDDIVGAKDQEKDAKGSDPNTPDVVKKEKKVEKWRSYDEEKQKKLYENALFPVISHVMSKYKHKIPRDDLKRFGKEIAKKLVNSDFKANRVKDPTKIDEKQQKKVKAFCKEYFDKAAHKHKKYEAEKLQKSATKSAMKSVSTPSVQVTPSQSPDMADETPTKLEMSDDEEMKLSDDEIEPEDTHLSAESPIASNGNLKRKRPDLDIPAIKDEEDSDTIRSPAKKLNFDSEAPSPQQAHQTLSPVAAPPPPPPPAPPVDTPPESGTPLDDTQGIPGDEMDTDLHADTNFKRQSMADVLAQAQREGDDDEEDTPIEHENTPPTTKFEQGLGANSANGAKPNGDVKMENPMVQGQEVVKEIKRERETS